MKYNPDDVLRCTRETLKDVGIPCSLKGYRALEVGIPIVVENPSLLDAITKDFYPDVAKKLGNGNTSSRVERAMRHAIEVAFNNVSSDILYSYFGNAINPNKGKPTNKEFVAVMARQVQEALNG